MSGFFFLNEKKFLLDFLHHVLNLLHIPLGVVHTGQNPVNLVNVLLHLPELVVKSFDGSSDRHLVGSLHDVVGDAWRECGGYFSWIYVMS